ncbi:hypothetical protein HPP92_016973 [Vanilla planifolia]|uniref:Uncharacterized protein n=1 Tax=Vanilla planifolia TaxID=51239 RepID=A0A835QP90_VANPL|nr:hypothetical protein HPP92_016973 [Vanilla planifolia]
MGDGFVIQLHNGGVIYRSSIQNISPILDFSVVVDHEEKQTELFACCGMSPMGSLRIISGGLSLEKLVKTPPIYQGITGTWSLRMKKDDPYHSFLVLSFVEETRILSVGLRFFDITDVTGFQPDVCTLACGLVSDGLLVQIHRAGVRLCLPTTAAHIEGVLRSMPLCSSWIPSNLSISSGAVGHNLIVVATSNPCFLYVLGIKSASAAYPNELYEIHHLRMQHEVSCISIPEQEINCEWLSTAIHLIKNEKKNTLCREYESNPIFVIGTHKPSVEVVSFVHGQGFRFLTTGAISVEKSLGTPISSCIPEDVRIVSVDKFYVLVGLRNGMLLRYEFPQISMAGHFAENKQSGPDMVMLGSSVRPSFDNLMELIGGSRPVPLQLIAIRRIGISPVVLVPIRDSNDADVIVLGDRPWFLHAARNSLVYTSISFQPATHATSVCFVDCPNGILFVAENSLHLVELGLGKRLNVPKLSINGTLRKVLYYKEGKTLLILRTGLSGASFSSDICQVDPISGALVSKFICEPGETAKCMELVKIGHQNLLVVGTSHWNGRTIMPSGEAELTKGRLIVLNLDGTHNAPESSSSLYCPTSSPPCSISSPMHEILGYSSQSSSCIGNSPDRASDDGIKIAENDSWKFKIVYQNQLSGAVLAICAYLNRYIIASAGNTLNVFCFVTDNPLRLLKYSMTKTRFTITSLTTCFSRIAVGDCRDGILFYSFQDDLRKLELLYSDPELRLVADCTLVNMDTAVVSDRRGSISVLSNVNHLEGSESPEKNLLVNCSFYLGESAMRIQKGFFSYKVPVDDAARESDAADVDHGSPCNTIVASTLLGSLLVLIPVTSEERHLLAAVQARLAVHPLTAPVLGNDLVEFRGRSTQACVPNMLDGDMLTQFLELTITQQEAVLAITDDRIPEPLSQVSLQLSVNQVTKLLERIYHAST